MVKFLFLILNYKTYQATIKVTYELLTPDRDDYKILIVDNASPNESFQRLREEFKGNEHVEIIQSPENGGYAKGNNYGLRFAKSINPRFVCIINNDVHFSWDTIESLAGIYTILENPAFISPLQKLPDGSILQFPKLVVPDIIYDLRMNSRLFKPAIHTYCSNTKFVNVQRVGFIPGAFLFIDYRKFEEMGFFDECTFLFCEERFTGKRVEELGLSNYLILDRTYLHEHSKTINSEASEKRQREYLHEGRKLYHKRYGLFPLLNILLLSISYRIQEFEIYISKYLKR